MTTLPFFLHVSWDAPHQSIFIDGIGVESDSERDGMAGTSKLIPSGTRSNELRALVFFSSEGAALPHIIL